MMPLRAAASRLPAARLLANVQNRSLSAKGTEAVTKFKQILEEYRVQNYSQEIPSRFKKEVISAAKRREDGQIALDGMQRVLHNIGRADRISPTEMELIFKELGDSGVIPPERMIQLM